MGQPFCSATTEDKPDFWPLLCKDLFLVKAKAEQKPKACLYDNGRIPDKSVIQHSSDFDKIYALKTKGVKLDYPIYEMYRAANVRSGSKNGMDGNNWDERLNEGHGRI